MNYIVFNDILVCKIECLFPDSNCVTTGEVCFTNAVSSMMGVASPLPTNKKWRTRVGYDRLTGKASNIITNPRSAEGRTYDF